MSLPTLPATPETSPDLDTLLHLLEQGITNLDELCSRLSTTPEVLEDLLDSDDLGHRHRIQAKLAHTALKCHILKIIPQLFTRLQELLNSDKPEVARRACNTLLHLAGYSTSTPKAAPFATREIAKPEPPEPPEGSGPDRIQQRINSAMDLLSKLEHHANAATCDNKIGPFILTPAQFDKYLPSPYAP